MTFKNEIVKENIIVDNLGFPLMKLTAAFMSCVHSVTKGFVLVFQTIWCLTYR